MLFRSLVFKEASIPKLVMDDKQRIIAIGDTSVMPMTSGGVRKLFAEMEDKGKGRTIEHEPANTIQAVEETASPIAATG